MAQPRQLELWKRSGVAPAAARAEDLETAERLSPDVRLGTSSWSFPGWAGIVYARAASRTALAREGLGAYASHPLLRCVGVDRTYYAPPEVADLRAYAAQVPEDFRFVLKAPEQSTWLRFPSGPRGGARAGEENPLALDASFAAERFVGPCVTGLGEKLGALVFQFPPQPGEPAFAERLGAFLEALPVGPLYAVEIRTRAWLDEDFAAALDAGGAVPCLTVHPAMPEVDTQAEITRAAGRRALVVRWNLGHGRRYEEARERYAPFDRIVDEDPKTRGAIARLCRKFTAEDRPSYVTINNKAEGSAPLSAFRLAAEISR